MSKEKDLATLIEAYALGGLSPKEMDELHKYLFSAEEHPWQDLGEYQNITALLASFLDIDPPPNSVIQEFRKSLAALPGAIPQTPPKVTFPPIVEEEEHGLRPQSVMKDTASMREQDAKRVEKIDEQENREKFEREKSKTQIKGREKEISVRDKYASPSDRDTFNVPGKKMNNDNEKHSVRDSTKEHPHIKDDLQTKERHDGVSREDVPIDRPASNDASRTLHRKTSELHSASQTGGEGSKRVAKDIHTKVGIEDPKGGFKEHKTKHVHSEKRINKDNALPKITRTDFGQEPAKHFRTTREEIANEKYADKEKWHVSKTPYGSMVTIDRNPAAEKKITSNQHTYAMKQKNVYEAGAPAENKNTAIWVLIVFLFIALGLVYFLLSERLSDIEALLNSGR